MTGYFEALEAVAYEALAPRAPPVRPPLLLGLQGALLSRSSVAADAAADGRGRAAAVAAATTATQWAPPALQGMGGPTPLKGPPAEGDSSGRRVF